MLRTAVFQIYIRLMTTLTPVPAPRYENSAHDLRGFGFP
jgi:hypothetical protein